MSRVNFQRMCTAKRCER